MSLMFFFFFFVTEGKSAPCVRADRPGSAGDAEGGRTTLFAAVFVFDVAFPGSGEAFRTRLRLDARV